MNSSNPNQSRMEDDSSDSGTESLFEKTSTTERGNRSGNNSADNETDAVGEGLEAFQLDPSSEDTECYPNLISKKNVQQETAIKTRQMTRNLPEKTVDNGIIDDTPFLPAELKYDHFEILILNAETDDNEAINLKEHVENNVTFCGLLKPNVILLKDVIPINKDGDVLDDAFKRTLYVFLYVTEEFCKHSWSLFQSHSCLKRALTSKEDRWSIIPVHTSPNNKRKYELPLMLDGLWPLNYFSKTFYQDVKRLLEHKSNVILERRATLEEKRQQFREANHKELCKLRSLGLRTQNVIVPTLKMKENLPNMPIKASVPNSESQNRISAETQEQNQVTDSTCRSSQQKAKNTAASQQQWLLHHQQQQQQQQWLHHQQLQQQKQQWLHHQQQHHHQQQQQQQQMNTGALCTKKSYPQPKRSEPEDISLSEQGDISLAITTDSPSNTEICEASSGKDIHSLQMGLRSGLDCNKSSNSDSVKTQPVKCSSLPEPADDKPIPEDLTPNAFNPTESNASHKGSHINLPPRHSHSKVSDILSEEGSHPNFNDGLQRVSSNTVPINPVTFSGASPSSPAHDVPRSMKRLSENVSTIAGVQMNIHIHQATYVAIGEHGQINVLSRSEDADDSEDSENGNSYSQINISPLPSISENTDDSDDSENGNSYSQTNVAPLPSRSEDTEDSTSRQQQTKTTNHAINKPNQERQLQNMTNRATGRPTEGESNREARRPTEGEPNREARRPTEGEPNREAKRPTEGEPNRAARRPTEGEPNRKAKRPTEGEPNREARRPTKGESNREAKRPEGESNREARRPADGELNREARRPADGEPNREARRPAEGGSNRTTRRPTEEEPNITARLPTKRGPRKCVIC